MLTLSNPQLYIAERARKCRVTPQRKDEIRRVKSRLMSVRVGEIVTFNEIETFSNKATAYSVKFRLEKDGVLFENVRNYGIRRIARRVQNNDVLCIEAPKQSNLPLVNGDRDRIWFTVHALHLQGSFQFDWSAHDGQISLKIGRVVDDVLFPISSLTLSPLDSRFMLQVFEGKLLTYINIKSDKVPFQARCLANNLLQFSFSGLQVITENGIRLAKDLRKNIGWIAQPVTGVNTNV